LALKLGFVESVAVCFVDNCVLSTYRGAEDLDFHPILLRGALASDNAQNIHLVENISEIISLGTLKCLLAV